MQSQEERRAGAMRVGAGVLIAFGLLALTAGYERQQGAGINMMLSSSGNSAVGAGEVAARAAAVGAKAASLSKGVEETAQRTATSPETKAEIKAAHVSPRSAASAKVQSLPTIQGEPIVTIINGTINVTEGTVYVDNDTGSIGPDGKRQGALADMPNFGFPVFMAVGGIVLLVVTCAYMSYCVKPEKRGREPKEKSRREKEAAGASPNREF